MLDAPAKPNVVVIVGSENPVKINSVKEAFESSRLLKDHTIEVRGKKVASGVSDQPMSSKETRDGANNRCTNCEEAAADFCVGIEGGLDGDGEFGLEAFAWVVIRRASDGQVGRSRTSCFYLPTEVTNRVLKGEELGHAVDNVFRQNNSKQKGGAVGLLTNGLIGRTEYYTQAVVLALIPFLNPDLFPSSDGKEKA